MPYIEPVQRERIDPLLAPLIDIPMSAGEINYVFARILIKFTTKWRKLSYLSIAIAIGILITCALEYYRRVAAKYENQKVEENGDVYE